MISSELVGKEIIGIGYTKVRRPYGIYITIFCKNDKGRGSAYRIRINKDNEMRFSRTKKMPFRLHADFLADEKKKEK